MYTNEGSQDYPAADKNSCPQPQAIVTGFVEDDFPRPRAGRMVCDDSSEWNVCTLSPLLLQFSSTSVGGQALDRRGWGPLLYRKLAAYTAALPRDEEEAGKPGQNTWRRARGTAGGEHH